MKMSGSSSYRPWFGSRLGTVQTLVQSLYALLLFLNLIHKHTSEVNSLVFSNSPPCRLLCHFVHYTCFIVIIDSWTHWIVLF